MKIISSKSIEDISILTAQLFDFIGELPHTSIKDPIMKVHHLQFINSIRERCGLPPIILFKPKSTMEFIRNPKRNNGSFYCPERWNMTKKELCNMCNEYSTDTKCEMESDCKLLKIVEENKSLKDECKQLKKQISDFKIQMSYMTDPNAIGDRHEMGCW